MSISYRVIERTFGFDETKSKKYVVKAEKGQLLSFGDLCVPDSRKLPTRRLSISGKCERNLSKICQLDGYVQLIQTKACFDMPMGSIV